ncbi:hypothetical protein [Haloactinomyces albus]|uniref:Uncharacterized protein n=1 Tax=Haloactinomyces albus TaxID=1352928 RepID=A0AAE3ZA35_9ACTN|nr:hypothetical protein [Haloactinomyces albus]MDR7301112.1 hypothetical protein [Haloactinomyces albus]
MSDPRSGPDPDDPDREYRHEPPPPPRYPTPASEQREQPPRPPMPALVHYLTIGLFVLVALQALSAVLLLATMPAVIDTAVDRMSQQTPRVSPEQIETFTRITVIGAAVLGLVLAALFLWLTIMVRKGRNWARITSTVFLALGVLFGLGSLGGGAGIATVISTIMLLLEIAVLIMLWLRPSNEYFRPERHPA